MSSIVLVYHLTYFDGVEQELYMFSSVLPNESKEVRLKMLSIFLRPFCYAHTSVLDYY